MSQDKLQSLADFVKALMNKRRGFAKLVTSTRFWRMNLHHGIN